MSSPDGAEGPLFCDFSGKEHLVGIRCHINHFAACTSSQAVNLAAEVCSGGPHRQAIGPICMNHSLTEVIFGSTGSQSLEVLPLQMK